MKNRRICKNNGGIIQRRGPHFKICKCSCEQKFRGRRNQEFVYTWHKDNFHNMKKAERDEEMKPINDMTKTNHRLLKEFYPQSRGEKSINFSPLLRRGFDSDGLTGLSKNNSNGRDIIEVHNYSYSISDNKLAITL
jgi:hypothetical protein